MSERASERDAVARFLRAMAATFDSHDTVGDREQEIADVIRSLATEITDEEHAEFRAERDGRFELADHLVVARLADQRDELRRVLADVLDGPFPDSSIRCVFCGCWCAGEPMNANLTPQPHQPDCPVLRRDALLGREGTST